MNALASALGTFRTRWRAGRFAAAVIAGGALFLGILFALGLVDVLAAFTDGGRLIAFGVLALLAACASIWAVVQGWRVNARQAAVEADRALNSARRDVLNAQELAGKNGEPDESLHGWLQARLNKRVAQRLSTLRVAESLPRVHLIRSAKWLGLAAAVCALFAIVSPRAAGTAFGRLLQPGADIPPYTPLVFNLQPNPARVLYGADLIVRAVIEGGAVKEGVTCVARYPRTLKLVDLPAFLEGENRYACKLERLTEDVELAFMTGRLRSHWLPVSVLLQPRIVRVDVTVTPPAYSRREPYQLTAGSRDLAPIPGSRLTAVVTSNRPLAGGSLDISYASGSRSASAAGERPPGGGTDQVAFEWTSGQDPQILTFIVRDVQGTASDPFDIKQKTTPDELPRIALVEPVGAVYATPDSEVPIEAAAEDDLGLSNLAWVRTLTGYRERTSAEAVVPGSLEQGVKSTLRMAPLGLQPGQSITVALEGRDTNPNLLGLAVSETANIHIISREQYAELMRAQATLEEFSARYEAMRDAMEAARRGLDEMKEAAQSGLAEKIEAARLNALEKHKTLAALIAKLKIDFPLFTLDSKLAAASSQSEQPIAENIQNLEGLGGGSSAQSLLAQIERMNERLGNEPMKQVLEDAAMAKKAGRVFEQTGRFLEILQQQRDIVKGINRLSEQIRRGETASGAEVLKSMGNRQHDIERDLKMMMSELDRALADLPIDKLGALQMGGREFLGQLEGLNVPADMARASDAAEFGQSRPAGEEANKALAKMESMLRSGNCLGGMCRGEEPKFPWPEEVSETLAELMRALCRGPSGSGSDPGGTGGFGIGWVSDFGQTAEGNSPRIPVFGPNRLSFRKQTPSSGRGVGGQGVDGEAGGIVRDATTGGGSPAAARGESTAVDNVPAAYRDAVRKYFSSSATSTP